MLKKSGDSQADIESTGSRHLTRHPFDHSSERRPDRPRPRLDSGRHMVDYTIGDQSQGTNQMVLLI